MNVRGLTNSFIKMEEKDKGEDMILQWEVTTVYCTILIVDLFVR